MQYSPGSYCFIFHDHFIIYNIKKETVFAIWPLRWRSQIRGLTASVVADIGLVHQHEHRSSRICRTAE